MDCIWNNINLTSPPVNTYKCFNTSLDVSKLHTILSDAQSYLESQQGLHTEAAIVSRLVYKMGRKFRHDIGHSYIRRTNTALLKYLNLNYVNDVKILLSVVPESFHENYIYAPTRQMLEYVLIRTQTLAKILFRISVCAKSAAIFSFERLKRGDSAWLSLIPYSVLARIWLLTKRFLKNVCKWYSGLIPFLNKLDVIGIEILPKEYKFPSDLSVWININELDAQSINPWNSSDILQQICNYESEQNLENDRLENDAVEQFVLRASNKIRNRSMAGESEDVGAKISREEYVKMQTNEPVVTKKLAEPGSKKPNIEIYGKKSKMKVKSSNLIDVNVTNNDIFSKKTTKSHSVASVTCLKSLSKFFKNEDKLRANNFDNAISRDVGVMQWQTIKNNICKKMLKVLKKKSTLSPEAFNKIFEVLWNNK